MKKALFLMILLAAPAAFGSERIWEQSYQVDRGARFSLECHKGFIRIRTDNSRTIQVTARIYFEEGGDSELLEHAKIKESSGPGHVSLEFDYDQDAAKFAGLIGNSMDWPAVDWEIVLPDDLNLELETHKSEVDLHVPAGHIDIESHKGTGTISGVRSDFSLETHKGEFDVAVSELSDLDVETHKGNISLAIYGTADFTLRAQSDKGNLRFSGYEVPITRDEDDDDEITAFLRVGDGTNRIELETYKGTIKVDFVKQ
jgi:hypothetical protein